MANATRPATLWQVQTQSKPKPRFQIKPGRILIFCVLALGAIMFAIPFLWLLSSALKEPAKIWLFPPQWIPNPARWENFSEALSRAPFFRYALNTLTIVVFNIMGTMLSTSLAAYAFARLRFPGRDIVFTVLLSTLMLPWAVTMIPNYVIFKNLGWLDTFLPLIVPSWFAAGPGCVFYIFLLRQFFRTIPKDYGDAARIDGATEFGIYWRIMMPLARPALITVAIFTFLASWNDLLGPLLYLRSPSNYTVSLGLASFKGLYATDWHYLMAASAIAVLPVLILFFVAQRYFLQGVVMSGLKG